MGARVPDLRGLFLRGLGGESAALGVSQNDTMRPITGRIIAANGTPHSPISNGAFSSVLQSGTWRALTEAGNGISVDMNSALLGPNYSGTETRPVNTAVRYLIKAMR